MALLNSPLSQSAQRAGGTVADMYGMCSVEDFPSGVEDVGYADLQHTHGDVQGFHDYVAKFAAPNFWFKDAAVQPWVYDQAYDNWQDQYGFDAACVVYHSGHGDMDANGVYECPTGGEWDGRNRVHSNAMRLGDNNARYVFFSTCLSLRVLDGMDPVNTWHGANGGFRMLFGFETTSVDDPDYGRFFWEEWEKNKSFSTAWLDASWRIDRNQAASVVACGATEAEARTRLYNERQFERSPASSAFYSWRWYNAESAGRARQANRALPFRPAVAVLAPPSAAGRRLAELAERFDISVTRSTEGPAEPGHPVVAGGGDTQLVVDSDGGYEVTLAQPAEPAAEVDLGAIRSAAERAIQRCGLAEDRDLIFDDVRYDYLASASSSGDGSATGPRIHEAVVNFRQVINGLPVTTPGCGEIRVRVDSEANVTTISDSTRQIAELVERPRSTVGPPDRGGRGRGGPVLDEAAAGQLLDRAVQRQLRRVAAGGRMPAHARVVPGSAEIGYHIADRSATVVARRTVEVDCGAGMAKRYPVQVSLLE